MKKLLALSLLLVWAAPASAMIIATDPAGDGFGIGIMDLLQLEADSDGVDLTLTLTINGDITTDWGKYVFWIDTDNVTGSGGGSAHPPAPDANPWVRNIAIGDATHYAEYWIGSWVDGPGGAQLWSFDSGAVAWNLDNTYAVVMNPGATSTVEYTFPLADMGLSVGDTIYLEGMSTGGNDFDTAVDTVNNPSDDWNPVDWQDLAVVANSTPYTIIPEPASLAMLALGAVALVRRR
jgi:hypothetical protein